MFILKEEGDFFFFGSTNCYFQWRKFVNMSYLINFVWLVLCLVKGWLCQIRSNLHFIIPKEKKFLAYKLYASLYLKQNMIVEMKLQLLFFTFFGGLFWVSIVVTIDAKSLKVTMVFSQYCINEKDHIW